MFTSLRKRYLSLPPKTREIWLIGFSLALFYVVVCMPILCAGYYGDDAAVGSLTKGMMLVRRQSLLTYALDTSLGWTTLNGRVYPLLFMANIPFHYLFDTVASYQTARVVLIIISLFPFAWLLKILTGKREAGLAFLFFIPLFWSIRYFFDSFTSFATLMPQVTLFAGLTLCFYAKAEDTGRRSWHIGGMIAYFLALMTYETGVVVYPALLALAWAYRRSFRGLLWGTWLYLVLTILYFLANAIARHNAESINGVYEGILIGKMSRFLPTLAMQLSGTLPLSHSLFGPMHYFLRVQNSYRHILLFELISSAIIGPLALFWFYRLLPKIKFSEKAKTALIGIGLSFLIIPACIISLSEKYQGLPPYEGYGLHWGVSYLPVYMQYIGLAMLCLLWIASKLNHIAPAKKSFVTGVLAVLLSGILCISVAFNHQVVRQQNDEWQSTRDLVEDALHHGLMTETSPVRNIFTIVSKRALWNKPEYYAQNVHLIPRVLDTTTDPESILPQNKSAGIVTYTDHPTYMLDYEAFQDFLGRYTGGYVVLGKIKAMHFATMKDQRKVTSFTLEKTRVYILENPEAPLARTLQWLQEKLPSDKDRATLLDLLAHNPISDNKNWTLVEFPSGQTQEWLQ